MKTICLYFQVHQPFRLRTYRFFEIGNDHYYYDDYANESILQRIAKDSYLPANEIMYDLIEKSNGKFKITFSISGIALDQFNLYAPEVLKSFQKLAKTGNVEFLAETYSHSISSLIDKEEFIEQVKLHAKTVEKYFGVKPKVFRNTELVYSDDIGKTIAEMGFKAILSEGAKHILGWKSPNYLYYNTLNPKLKVLLRNYKFSDDIAFRFSDQAWDEWPLTADKYISWFNNINEKEEIINLFMDYETFGEHQKKESGIFEFLKAFPKAVFDNSDFTFSTPTEVANTLQPVAAIHVPYPISWADEERDLTAWLGNDLQDEAFHKLYKLKNLVKKTNNKNILKDWSYLQTSDHFYYMCTKFFSDGDVHSYFNPYQSPYDAFINYMNVLNDFTIRVKQLVSKEEPQVVKLQNQLSRKEKQLTKYKNELKKLKSKIDADNKKPVKKVVSKAKAKPNTKATTTSSSKKTKPNTKTIKKQVKRKTK